MTWTKQGTTEGFTKKLVAAGFEPTWGMTQNILSVSPSTTRPSH